MTWTQSFSRQLPAITRGVRAWVVCVILSSPPIYTFFSFLLTWEAVLWFFVLPLAWIVGAVLMGQRLAADRQAWELPAVIVTFIMLSGFVPMMTVFLLIRQVGEMNDVTAIRVMWIDVLVLLSSLWVASRWRHQTPVVQMLRLGLSTSLVGLGDMLTLSIMFP